MSFPWIFTQKIDEPLSPLTEEEINRIKENVSKYSIRPAPNDDVEFIVPLFNARKYYKKLKRMLWKYGKIR